MEKLSPDRINEHLAELQQWSLNGDLLQRTLGQTIEIETAMSRDLWSCAVDPTQLEHALLNLVINARDAMPRGGTLLIETSNCTLSEDEISKHQDFHAGEYVLLSLTDSGIGMPEEVVQRAFEPFYSTKGIGRGSDEISKYWKFLT